MKSAIPHLVCTSTFLSVALCAAYHSPENRKWKPLPRQDLPPVESTALQDSIESDALLSGALDLERIAYANNGNRATGSQGHNDTVTYLYNQLTSLGDYYNVTLQPWSAFVDLGGNITLTIDGTLVPAQRFTFGPSGNVEGQIVPVGNLGCNATDYPSDVNGNVALISRGSCEFGLKSVNAGLAGAVGAIIYNNVPGNLSGTLGEARPEGPYVPTAGITQALGAELINNTTSQNIAPSAQIDVVSQVANRSTFNVLAQSRTGDQDNVLMLGAHADSVPEGPGINDDGSGSIANLEIAKQLSNYSTTNAVRFGWWSGEEQGLLGSTYYVSQLSSAEASKIRLYLNFDMVASPNYIYAIYDGDGSAFNLSGPAGSAEAEQFFEEYFQANNLPSEPTAFDGRSDYGPFLDAGIAAGGLFTGAEENKTEEQASLFGGTAGVALDPNYHTAADNVTNLNLDAFLVNTRAIADAVGVFGQSFDRLNQTAVTKRAVEHMRLRGSGLRTSMSSQKQRSRREPMAVWNLSPSRHTLSGRTANGDAGVRARPRQTTVRR